MKTLSKAIIVLIFASATRLYSAYELQAGGAFVNLSDSNNIMYYNPAGLVNSKRPELSGSYSKLYAGLDDGSDLSDGYVSLSFPLTYNSAGAHMRGRPSSAVGMGVSLYGLSNLYNESSAGIYYSRFLGSSFLAGAAVKYLTVSYGRDDYSSQNSIFSAGTSKSNISIDVGGLYRFNDNFSLGLSVRDLNMPDMGLKYENIVARKTTAGCLYRQKSYTFAGDVSFDTNNNFKLMAGGERRFVGDRLSVKCGFGFGSSKYSQINIGSGYNVGDIFVDYTFNYPLSGLSDIFGSHKIAFGYRFGEYVDEVKKNASAIIEEAKAKIAEGKYADAGVIVLKAMELDPQNQEYILLNKNEEFVRAYVDNANGDDKFNSALRSGIKSYLLDKDAAVCVKQLTYAYSLNPDKENVYKLLKEIADKNGIKIEDSAKTWDIVEQKVYQTFERFKEGKYDECIKLCEEILVLDPNNVTAYKRLGSTFYVLDNPERAKKNWLKAIELAPNDEDIPNIKELLEKIK